MSGSTKDSLRQSELVGGNYQNFHPMVWGRDNPQVVPTKGSIGQIYVLLGTLNVYQKTDNGVSTNWTLLPFAPTSISGVNTGAGAQILNLPFASNIVSAKTLKPSTTTQQDYILVNQLSDEISFGFDSAKFFTDFPSFSLTVQGSSGINTLNFVGASVVESPAGVITVTITPPTPQITVNSIPGIEVINFTGFVSVVQGPSNTVTVNLPASLVVSADAPIVSSGGYPTTTISIDPATAQERSNADYSVFDSISLIKDIDVRKIRNEFLASPNPEKNTVFFNDFSQNFSTSIGNNTFLGEGFYALSAGTGANAQNNQLPVNSSQVGILRCQSGSTTTGRSGYLAAQTGIRFGEMNLLFETSLRIVGGLSTALEEYNLRCGFIKNATTAGNIFIQDGMYFQYRDSGSTPHWQAVIVDNNTASVIDTGVAPSTGNYQKLRIFARRQTGLPNDVCEFYIDNVLVAQFIAGLPSNAPGREFGVGMYIAKVAGTGNRTFDSDFCFGMIERMKTGLR